MCLFYHFQIWLNNTLSAKGKRTILPDDGLHMILKCSSYPLRANFFLRQLSLIQQKSKLSKWDWSNIFDI